MNFQAVLATDGDVSFALFLYEINDDFSQATAAVGGC